MTLKIAPGFYKTRDGSKAAEAAEAYKKHLPNMEPIGAAKYSSHLGKAMKLREALKAWREKEKPRT